MNVSVTVNGQTFLSWALSSFCSFVTGGVWQIVHSDVGLLLGFDEVPHLHFNHYEVGFLPKQSLYLILVSQNYTLSYYSVVFVTSFLINSTESGNKITKSVHSSLVVRHKIGLRTYFNHRILK